MTATRNHGIEVEQLPYRRPEERNRYVELHDGFVLVRKLIGYSEHRSERSHAIGTAHYRWLLFMDGVLVDSNDHMRPLRWGARRDHYQQQLWEKSW